MATQVPEGWYVDPSDRSLYRYWSGEHWTTHTHDKALVDIAAVESEMRPLPDFDALDDEGNPTPTRERRRRIPVLLAVLALVVLVATAGVVAFKPETTGHSLTGEIRVPVSGAAGTSDGSGAFAGEGARCGGSEGQGVASGTPVMVTSARGEELGQTELGEGRLERTLASTACVFSYTVDGVGDASVYIVRVGHRRVACATRASVEAADWQLDGRMG